MRRGGQKLTKVNEERSLAFRRLLASPKLIRMNDLRSILTMENQTSVKFKTASLIEKMHWTLKKRENRRRHSPSTGNLQDRTSFLETAALFIFEIALYYLLYVVLIS